MSLERTSYGYCLDNMPHADFQSLAEQPASATQSKIYKCLENTLLALNQSSGGHSIDIGKLLNRLTTLRSSENSAIKEKAETINLLIHYNPSTLEVLFLNSTKNPTDFESLIEVFEEIDREMPQTETSQSSFLFKFPIIIR